MELIRTSDYLEYQVIIYWFQFQCQIANILMLYIFYSIKAILMILAFSIIHYKKLIF